jgi:uncharacterized protein YjbI with pentapeptide repeats
MGAFQVRMCEGAVVVPCPSRISVATRSPVQDSDAQQPDIPAPAPRDIDSQAAPSGPQLPDLTAALSEEPPVTLTPSRKSALGRALSRTVPRPPFAGKRLGRAEVMQLLGVAADTNRPGQIDLRGADLREADLSGLDLAGARLGDDDPLATDADRHDFAAVLDRAVLVGTRLDRIIAPAVRFDEANLQGASLIEANLAGATLAGAHLAGARLSHAKLTNALLTGAVLTDAWLDGAGLVGVSLAGARLTGAHLESADLGLANLQGTDLRYAYCDEQTFVGGALLQGAWLEGVRWRDADLSAVDWGPVRTLGEEQTARAAPQAAQSTAWRLAARTYRRLGILVRTQGLTGAGNRFTARARHMERHALWSEMRDRWVGRRLWPATVSAARWLGALTQGLVTGYGEHPIWVAGWALLLTFLFSVLFALLTPGLNFGAALLLSAGTLLGRGFTRLPGIFAAPGLVSFLAIAESAVGIVLEVLFALALARKTQG